jgi:prepilin-type N-terminal cleavage/methylation domain-containing protein
MAADAKHTIMSILTITIPRERNRRAFSLIEVLTVVGVIGILIALVLPAVQSAREAAWRASCSNNLRQLAIAIQVYHSDFGVFPAAWGGPNVMGNRAGGRITSVEVKQFSIFTQLLPSLDGSVLFNAVNFEVGVQDPYMFSIGPQVPGFHANDTVMSTSLGVLLCPSDGGAGDSGWTAGGNYRANLGTDRWYYSTDGPFMDQFTQLSASAVTDGLSQTVGLSEKLRGRVEGQIFNRDTDMLIGGLALPFSAEQSLVDCAARMNQPTPFITASGLTWFVGTLSQSCYNHILGPNSRIADCVLAGGNPVSGLVGARSEHPGGVHAGMLDGSVRFVTESIDRAVWKAMGSRAGGEIITP